MFRTEISHIHGRFELNHGNRLLSLGSCFAENIGQKLSEYKFDIEVNPVGILFNPLSIFELLELATSSKTPETSTYLEQQGTWLNYKFHSSINADNQRTLERKIDDHLKALKGRLEQSDTLILTFGTAWVYRSVHSEMLVANCHKVSQKEFSKSLLEPDEIRNAFISLKDRLDQVKPGVRVILSVSPVRHTKEGLSNNNLSKSILRLACHQLSEQFADVDYFPAYEILMDDLRDYRFYEKDMIHPNEQAQDYVWSKFCETYFNEDSLELMTQWKEILNALNHKAFHPDSDKHQKFLRNTLTKLENLKSEIDVSDEIDHLKNQLI